MSLLAQELGYMNQVGAFGAHGILQSPMIDVSRAIGQTFNTTSTHTASQAQFAPILVQQPVTIYKLGWLNGATVSGNVDAGIYDRFGTRLVSTGSTAQTTISTLQVVDTTDITLSPGRYFTAIAIDNATGILTRIFGTATLFRVTGCTQMASAFPLPATATFAAYSINSLPLVVGATTGTVF